MKEFPELQTQRCVLNRITDNDIPVMRQIFDDEMTRKYLPELMDIVSSGMGINQMLSSFDTYLALDEGMIWAIRLDKVMIGFVAVMDLSTNPTIFYATHPNHRSQGYTKECVDAVLQYIFGHYSCQYMLSEVYKENTISMQVLSSVGFRITKKDRRKYYMRKDAE